jgi:hypothetical protein
MCILRFLRNVGTHLRNSVFRVEDGGFGTHLPNITPQETVIFPVTAMRTSKLKLSLCLVKRHTFLTSVSGGVWSASRFGRFIPSIHQIVGWVGPRAGLNAVGRKMFLLLQGIEP